MADSKLVNRVYEDLAQPGTKEVGQSLGEVLSGLRCFSLIPFLAGNWAKRIREKAEKAEQAVPEEHRREGRPEILFPIVKGVATTSDDSPLMDMFEELLRKAVDGREDEDQLHPEFPALISRLVPAQAVLLKSLMQQRQGAHKVFHVIHRDCGGMVRLVSRTFNDPRLLPEGKFEGLASDLESKKLIEIERSKPLLPSESRAKAEVRLKDGEEMVADIFRLTPLGHWFVNACIPSIGEGTAERHHPIDRAV